jgi:urea carboxylase system permease
VANLVLGAGPEAGAPLGDHPDVDLVSFTGGLQTGRRLMAAAAGTVKKVALELGGKNPNIVFADADFETAVDMALTAVFLHSGQVCSAGARLLVEDSLHDRFVDEVVRAGPADPARRPVRRAGADRPADLGGPPRQGRGVRRQGPGRGRGAALRRGGVPRTPPRRRLLLPADRARRVHARMTVVQEESFGPVLTVERFTDEAEAVRLANDTIYGLAGAVFTTDEAKAQRVAARLRIGTVWINDYHPYVPQAEWGGYKQSGFGRELGPCRTRRVPRDQAHLAQHRSLAAGLVLLAPATRPTSLPRLNPQYVVRSSTSSPRLIPPALIQRHPHEPLPSRPLPQAQESAHDNDRKTTQAHRHTDDAELAEFGYKPELKRTLGNFHTFAAGISYISILTGTFQLFYFGYGSGGPAYWWSWPMVFVGQFMVALCFAELAARYPVAGSVYNWSKKIGNPHLGWLAGWMMLIASIVSIAAVALAYQLTLPQISDVFQIVGDGTGKYDVATNAVLLASVLILFTTLVNAFGVKLMATINTAGVFIELIATVVLIVLFAVHITRGPQVVLETNGTGAGHNAGYLGAFLWPPWHPRTSCTASTRPPRSARSPWTRPATRRARSSGRSSPPSSWGLILLLALMSVSSLKGEQAVHGRSAVHRPRRAREDAGKAMLWCVLIAVTVCALAVHTAAIRLAFAMSRDNNLPASSLLAKVSPRFQTPVLPAVIIGILALAILVVNIRQPQIFTVVTSIGIIMIYLAYLGVTGPMLVARLRGKWQPAGRRQVLARPLGPARQHRRRGVGRGHDDQPDLAARRGLQRDGPLPLVSPVGRGPVRRRSSRAAASPTTGSSSGTGPVCSPSTVRGALGRVGRSPSAAPAAD